ncbi:MAG TPA: hypothetical protein VL992_06050 [Tepidisphaeraceae bacterium]|nr:hypothetical protein [Tepidisphaeraceae bacterium]
MYWRTRRLSLLAKEAVKRLDQIPAFDQRAAKIALAEIGRDMSLFPTLVEPDPNNRYPSE